jgi:hypothetical protein
MVSETVVLIAA